jgi:uncharacterized membrane protein YdbT with pleckstrin-like domain
MAPSEDPERTLWQGRFTARALAHYWLLYAIYVGLVLLAQELDPVRDLGLSALAIAGLILLPGLALLAAIGIKKLATRYRLSTQRIFEEKGILSRTMSEVELIRVDDVTVYQNLLQRILDVGRVMLVTTDATQPRFVLEGIASPIEVKEHIRSAVQKLRSTAVHVERI